MTQKFYWILLCLVTLAGRVPAETTEYEDWEPTYIYDTEGETIEISGTAPSYGPGDLYWVREHYEKNYPDKYNKKNSISLGTIFDVVDVIQKTITVTLDKQKQKKIWKYVDRNLAILIVNGQKTLLQKSQSALRVFKDVVLRDNAAALEANYGKVFQRFFIKKTVGLLVEAAPPGIKDALKLIADPELAYDLLDETKRAEDANVKMKISDFYVWQEDISSNISSTIYKGEADFYALVEKISKGSPPENIIQHSDLVMTYEAIETQVEAATPGKLFLDISGIFISESRFNDGAAHIKLILNEDNSVREAVIYSPQGEQMAKQINQYYPDGIDLRQITSARVHVTRFEKDNPWASGYIFYQDGLMEPYVHATKSSQLEKDIRNGKIPRFKFREETP